jgi:predicted DNA-binding protein (MmcQ/YjbR family)
MPSAGHFPVPRCPIRGVVATTPGKVGGKMFACIGAVMPGVSVKTDSIETAQMLIDAGVGVKAPYFHRSWVNLPWGTSEDELRYRLTASYKLVRFSLTKKAQAQLDSFE